MSSGKLGVVTFFGILVPGAYLAAVLLATFASVAELLRQDGHERVLAFVAENTVLSAGIFLFVAYLLGVLLRLFAPEYVDSISSWYLRCVVCDVDDWVTDAFPYEKTVDAHLQKKGMGKVTELMSRLNGNHPLSKAFFNYCKWFIEANAPALARQVQESEALVRFLSGTALALLVALPLMSSLLVVFAICGSHLNAALYGGLLISDLVCLAVLLRRFKYQRRREVILVWSSVHLLMNGGTSVAAGSRSTALARSVFFANQVQRQWPKRATNKSSAMATTANAHEVAEYVAVIREMIRHEDTVIHQRLGWLFALQGLLFAASSFFWEGSVGPFVTIGCVGLLSCISVGYSLGRAMRAIRALLDKARDRKNELPEAVRKTLPVTIGARDKALEWLLPARLLPWAIGVAWLAMITLRLCRLC